MPENEDDARPRVQVVDRRHWARTEGEGEAAGAGEEEAPSLLPTYVERLEARAREQEERLKAFLEEQKAENAAFRERVRREAERRAEESLAGLVEELVGVLDDLNRALNSARSAPAAPAPGDGAAILEGVRLVTDRLAAILQARGLERVPGEGEAFDPNVHEALGMIPVEDPEKENQVVEEVLPGYLLKGRLLRPARVRVGRLKPPPSAGSESAEATGERESS